MAFFFCFHRFHVMLSDYILGSGSGSGLGFVLGLCFSLVLVWVQLKLGYAHCHSFHHYHHHEYYVVRLFFRIMYYSETELDTVFLS